MAEELHSLLLKNDLLIRFRDETNRYYGDFHRVCIKVTLVLPESLDLPANMSREEVNYERHLEQMGVQTAQLDATRNHLINSFLTTSRAYLEKSDFPQQLLQKLRQGEKHRQFLR